MSFYTVFISTQVFDECLKTQMETLSLPSTVRSDDGLIAFAKCVKNVDKLLIVNEVGPSEFTPKGIQAISDGILKRDNPVSATYCDI